MNKVRVVVASQTNQADFFERTATGRSLNLYRFPFIDVRLFPENRAGLPKIYNSVIEESVDDPCMLIFMHDDVHIIDYYWVDQLLAGLNRFEVVGIAGNKRRIPRQPSWLFLDTYRTQDRSENLSGVIGHGPGFPPRVLNVFALIDQDTFAPSFTVTTMVTPDRAPPNVATLIEPAVTLTSLENT